MMQIGHKIRNQKSSLKILCALLFLALPLTLLVTHATAETTLKVGVYNNKPTIFTDDKQGVQGFFIDILESIAKEEGWQLEYTSGHFIEMLEMLQRGEIDLLPAVAYSTARDKFLDYTYDTVMTNWAELYTANHLNISSLTELEGKVIVAKGGDIHLIVLKEMTKRFNLSCRFLEADEYETVLEMIHYGAADVAVVNRLYGNRMKAFFDINDSPIIFNPIEMKYAVAKGQHQDILNKLDNRITALKRDKNSIYYQSLNRWFIVDNETQFPSWLMNVLYFVIGIAVILAASTAIFKNQITRRTRELKELNKHLEEQIIETKNAEEDLRKIARMVDASQDAMALVKSDHRHLFINNAYKELICPQGNATNYTSLKNLLPPGFYSKFLKAPIKKCLQGQTIQTITPPWKNEDERGWWNITFSPYHDQQNEITGFVIGIYDITEQMELENKLKIKQKMEAVGLLAGGVAHDLNNILSGIVSYPDMLLLNRDENDPLTKPLTTIKKSGERAAVIVQDMLTMSRRGAGDFSGTNLNTIVRDFIESPEYINITQQNLIDIDIQLDDNLHNILGSSVHLGKVVMNLFTNAIEAMPDGGRLTLSTTNTTIPENYNAYEIIPPGEYATLSLSDTGIGMSKEQKARIFEPFYSKKVLGRSGTGLGMAIVWGCMKDHNGFIDIQTEKNQFTRFTLYFPPTETVEKGNELIELDTLRGTGEKILLVDDLEEQRTLGEQILTNLGYSVDVAPSGEEAVQLCKAKKYDLLVLDMIMPDGIGGLETYKQILQITPHQKAVIASGFANNEKVAEAKRLGVGAYIQKPYSVDHMALTIHTELNREK